MRLFLADSHSLFLTLFTTVIVSEEENERRRKRQAILWNASACLREKSKKLLKTKDDRCTAEYEEQEKMKKRIGARMGDISRCISIGSYLLSILCLE